MNEQALNLFLGGVVTAGFFAGGLFFARFWTRSRDILFLAFTAAFWLLSLNQLLVSLLEAPEYSQSWFYLLRVMAFLLIAAAMVRKNAGNIRDDD